ncbi:P protein-like [Dermacentor andersoni]|uniref:P protein-like n=1 Tax=Dermacentor andersoni TaxID=34620 RepID=UPI002155393C|nr:P protein-like [Dermacentor andersoni]
MAGARQELGSDPSYYNKHAIAAAMAAPAGSPFWSLKRSLARLDSDSGNKQCVGAAMSRSVAALSSGVSAPTVDYGSVASTTVPTRKKRRRSVHRVDSASPEGPDCGCFTSSDEKTPLTRGAPSSMRRRLPSGSPSSCLSDDELLDPFCPPSKKGAAGSSCGLGGCERLKQAGHVFKKCFLVVALLAAVVLMGIFPEAGEHTKTYQFNISSGRGSHRIHLDDWHSPVIFALRGPFLHRSLANVTHVFTTVTLVTYGNSTSEGSPSRLSQIMRIPTVATVDAIAETSFVVKDQFTVRQYHGKNLDLLIEAHGSPSEVSYPLQSLLEPSEVEFGLSVLLAASVLTVLYLLIVFELVHRTLAALIGATMAVGSLCVVGERPSLTQVVSWLDVETLCLLFGMMILVGVLCETGFFDYAAVLAYRLAHGRIWPMVTTLCIFTAVISAFLDNVTTILLMTPVTIKLCEVMDLDPKHVLIILVVFSNIGGAATPVGDPPNVIIISNASVRSLGVSFTTFTAHMVPGVLLCAVGAYIYLRIFYRDVNKLRSAHCSDYLEMAHEIQVWQKAVFSLAEYSRDETHVRHVLRKKVRKLVRQQSKRSHYVRSATLPPPPPSAGPDPVGGKTASCVLAEVEFRENLRVLSEKYRIREPALLVKSTIVLASVIVLFFLQSIPAIHLTLGWIAILGAVMLMVLADTRELDAVIARVEWTTLIFFGALFVVMEALVELNLLLYVGHLTQNWIRSVHHDSRLIVSIMIITWVSALASSFVDNIPFTTVMIKIVTGLAESDLGLKLGPLIYALAFGACLGGNGTLIGASANVVCAGVAEQHGYKFSFFEFFRIGFPLMVLTTALSTTWLLVCHVAMHWDI